MNKEKNAELLIQYLINHNETWTNGNTLSEYLQISLRQLRNYVNEWNIRNPELILSCERGYRLNSEIYSEYLNSKKDLFTVNDRRVSIIKELAYLHAIDIFDLEEQYHISIPTLEADISSIRKAVGTYHIYIKRKQNQVSLSGHEKDIRNLLCDLYLNEHHHTDKNERQIYRSILNLCRLIRINCDERTIQSILAYINVTNLRIQQGWILPMDPSSSSFSSADQKNLFSSLLKNATYEELKELNRVFSAFQNNNTICLKPCILAITRLFHEFSKLECNELAKELTNWYQKETLYRDKLGFSHHRKHTLCFTYPLAFFLALRFHTFLHIDETTASMYDLTLLFATALLKNPIMISPLTATFVYQGDSFAADLMITEIESIFPNHFIMINKCSWYEYDSEKNDTDFILSNTSIGYSNKPLLQIHPLVNDKDKSRIRKMVKHLHHQKKAKTLITWLKELCTRGKFGSIDQIERSKEIMIIPNPGIQLSYLCTNTESYLNIYLDHKTDKVTLQLGIQVEASYDFLLHYDDLIALLSDVVYQRIIFPITSTTDFIAHIEYALQLYQSKLEN